MIAPAQLLQIIIIDPRSGLALSVLYSAGSPSPLGRVRVC